MNIQVLLTVLTIAELAIITSALAAFLFFRQRKLRRVAINAIAKANSNPAGSTPEHYLQTNIEATKEALKTASSENVEQLNQRIAFLQSELVTCSDDSDPEEYWDDLCRRISTIVPTTGTAALISGEDNNDLNQSSSETPFALASDHKPSQEITKLRNIINRQHDSVGELKQSLLDNETEVGQLSGLLKQIENIEVAQAQLNMSVDGVEKANLKLRQQVEEIPQSTSKEEPDTELEALPDLDLAALPDIDLDDNDENRTDSGINNQVLIANEKIERLESEAQEKDVIIEDLEQKVSGLEAQLQEQQAALLKANQQQNSISNDFMQSSDDPDVLTHQIEDLTDLLVQKSEELADLQYGKQEPFDTISDEIDDVISDTLSDEIEISTTDNGMDMDMDMDNDNDIHQSIDQFLDDEADNNGVHNDISAIPDINLDDDMIIPDIDDIVFTTSHDDADQSDEDPYFDLGVVDDTEDPSIPTIDTTISTVSGDTLRGTLDGFDEDGDDSDTPRISNTK